MFERFTDATRALVLEAQAQQQALGDSKVGTEHLLLALLADPGPAGDVLRQAGIQADQIVGPPVHEDGVTTDGGEKTDDDDKLLLELGIDVDAIRKSLDETLGPGALDRARADRATDGESAAADQGAERWHQDGFGSEFEQVLARSLHEALRLETRHIGPEHIGLSLSRTETGGQLLTADGLDLARLRESWDQIAIEHHDRSRRGPLHRLRH